MQQRARAANALVGVGGRWRWVVEGGEEEGAERAVEGRDLED